MKLTILPAAELEAAEAALWYDGQRLGLGDEFLAELLQTFDHIRRARESLSRAEFYSGSREIRRCLLRRFPYLVVFECRAEETLIIAISHARRRPLYWLDRL